MADTQSTEILSRNVTSILIIIVCLRVRHKTLLLCISESLLYPWGEIAPEVISFYEHSMRTSIKVK